jgi:hypothetical protein
VRIVDRPDPENELSEPSISTLEGAQRAADAGARAEPLIVDSAWLVRRSIGSGILAADAGRRA